MTIRMLKFDIEARINLPTRTDDAVHESWASARVVDHDCEVNGIVLGPHVARAFRKVVREFLRRHALQRIPDPDACVSCSRVVAALEEGITDDGKEYAKRCAVTLLDIWKTTHGRAAETCEHFLEVGTEVREEFLLQGGQVIEQAGIGDDAAVA
jgi:hypothetical protein